MEPLPIGQDINVEVSAFYNKMYAHIRKQINGQRSKFGVAFEKNEFDVLCQKTNRKKALPGDTTRWVLSQHATVTFTASGATFVKRANSITLTRQEYAELMLALPQMKRAMEKDPTTSREETGNS